MITLSEALSNFSGTTNYVAKYTPTGNVLGISLIFDNGTNVGIDTTSPTAKLHIKGIDSTSSNYGLKVDNSANSPLLYVRNDGQIEMNGFTIRQLSSATYFKTSGINGYFFNNFSDLSNIARLTNDGAFYINGNNSIEPNVNLSVASTGIDPTLKKSIAEFRRKTPNNTGVLISSKEGVSYIQGFTSSLTQNVDINLGGFSTSFGALETLTLSNDDKVGIGASSPSAKLHIQGTDSTSSNYALKIDNSTTNPLFYVRNDGVILANNLPTSSAGLPSGAIWNNSGVLNIV